MIKQLKFNINGMHCESCAKLIVADLSELPEVSDIQVDFKSKEGRISLDPEKVRLEDIEQVIKNLGYQIKWGGKG